MEEQKFVTGCELEKGDPRNLNAAAIIEEPLGGELPNELEVDAFITDQGTIDSCVGHAVAGSISTLEKEQVSPRTIWSLAKRLQGYVGWGTYISYALKEVVHIGAAKYGVYDESNKQPRDEYMKVPYDDRLLEESVEHKMKSYWWIEPGEIEMVKKGLIQFQIPFITSMPWRTSYNRPGANGILPYPDGNSAGHAFCIIGWDVIDGIEYAIFANSWGKTWGDRGKFRIKLSDLAKYNVGGFYIPTDIPLDIAKLINATHQKFVQVDGDSKIYYVEKGLKRHVSNELAFWLKTSESLTSGVKYVSQEEMDVLTEVSPIKVTDFPDQTLRVLRNMRDLYEINPAYAASLMKQL